MIKKNRSPFGRFALLSALLLSVLSMDLHASDPNQESLESIINTYIGGFDEKTYTHVDWNEIPEYTKLRIKNSVFYYLGEVEPSSVEDCSLGFFYAKDDSDADIISLSWTKYGVPVTAYGSSNILIIKIPRDGFFNFFMNDKDAGFLLNHDIWIDEPHVTFSYETKDNWKPFTTSSEFHFPNIPHWTSKIDGFTNDNYVFFFDI